jgi:hypothetical protein
LTDFLDGGFLHIFPRDFSMFATES